LAAVFINIEFCILIGVFLSFVLYVPRAAQVQLNEFTVSAGQQMRVKNAYDPECNKMLLFNVDGELSFGAEPELEKHLSAISSKAQSGHKVLLLFVRRARNPDAVFLGLLDAFLRKMQQRNIAVLLCGVRPDLKKGLESIGIAGRLGASSIIEESSQNGSTTEDAIRRAYELVGDDVCPNCPHWTKKPATAESSHYVI
jgi:SulP family sulfate permease